MKKKRIMNYSLLFAGLLGLAYAANAQDTSTKPLTVVPTVDLKRYMGTWYEIARLPNRFQKKCVSDVTATYSIRDDGDIQVVNRCRNEDGEMTEAVGRAKRASDDGPNTKLKVRFAPAFLSILPFVWGDYWIIALAQDYSYAVVGDPDRKYLWILSRTPSMDEKTFRALKDEISQKGYDLGALTKTVQTVR